MVECGSLELGVHVISEAVQDLANPGCAEVLQEVWH